MGDYGGTLSTSRLTGDGQFTDKQIFTLTDKSADSCQIKACSRSQVTSVLDMGTNYCALKMLYCGSADGCKPVESDFSVSTEVTEKFSQSSIDLGACLQVAEEEEHATKVKAEEDEAARMKAAEQDEAALLGRPLSQDEPDSQVPPVGVNQPANPISTKQPQVNLLATNQALEQLGPSSQLFGSIVSVLFLFCVLSVSIVLARRLPMPLRDRENQSHNRQFNPRDNL